jgi:hypothetical protein
VGAGTLSSRGVVWGVSEVAVVREVPHHFSTIPGNHGSHVPVGGTLRASNHANLGPPR